MQDNLLLWFVTFHFKVKCQIIWFTGASMLVFYLVISDLTQQNKSHILYLAKSNEYELKYVDLRKKKKKKKTNLMRNEIIYIFTI
jgi:hypothetical protein